MGALNKFLGKPKEIEINGEKIILHPLKVKDMHLFAKQDVDDVKMAEMTKQILKLSIPDTTDEEINDLPVEISIKIMEEINKLNGFTDERLDKIKAKQLSTTK